MNYLARCWPKQEVSWRIIDHHCTHCLSYGTKYRSSFSCSFIFSQTSAFSGYICLVKHYVPNTATFENSHLWPSFIFYYTIYIIYLIGLIHVNKIQLVQCVLAIANFQSLSFVSRLKDTLNYFVVVASWTPLFWNDFSNAYFIEFQDVSWGWEEVWGPLFILTLLVFPLGLVNSFDGLIC